MSHRGLLPRRRVSSFSRFKFETELGHVYPDFSSLLAMANARVKSENVGATVVLDKFSSKVFMSGIFNTTTLTIGLIFLLDNITVQG